MRFRDAFGALVLAQGAHSVEEYVGRLWESFPPARFLTGLVSSDRELGFIALNVGIAAFGIWCFMWPIRLGRPSARALAVGWAVVEMINGVVHPLWTLWQGRYTPGVATAPLLFILGLYLWFRLRETASDGNRP